MNKLVKGLSQNDVVVTCPHTFLSGYTQNNCINTRIQQYYSVNSCSCENRCDFTGISSHEGVDEATIVEVIAKRSNAQRQQIKEAYKQSTGKVSIFTYFLSIRYLFEYSYLCMHYLLMRFIPS